MYLKKIKILWIISALKIVLFVVRSTQMPVMDGVDACRHIVTRDKGSHPPAKVVFVTAHVSSSFKAKCIENGAFDYLAKPCCIEGVTRCLEQVSRAGLNSD